MTEATLLVSVFPAVTVWLIDGKRVLPALIAEIPAYGVNKEAIRGYTASW